jgi:hypothetical protein
MEPENNYLTSEVNEGIARGREAGQIRNIINKAAATSVSTDTFQRVSRSPIGYKHNATTTIGKTKLEKGGHSGYVIVRLSARISSLEHDDLYQVVKEQELENLVRLLDEYKPFQIKLTRLIHSLSPPEILKLERKAATSDFPPLHSLTSYWRLDARRLTRTESERLVRSLNELSEIDLAYMEMSGGDPGVNDADDPYAASQEYLDAAPIGIDARWVWTQPKGVGAGVGLVDLEQGWFPNHEDLIAKNPTLIHNDNKDGHCNYKGGHGTAVLGEIVGVDNTVNVDKRSFGNPVIASTMIQIQRLALCRALFYHHNHHRHHGHRWHH